MAVQAASLWQQMPTSTTMRRATMLERQWQKSCTDLLTMFELLCTIMFLYCFNNVCIDGVIQQ